MAKHRRTSAPLPSASARTLRLGAAASVRRVSIAEAWPSVDEMVGVGGDDDEIVELLSSDLRRVDAECSRLIRWSAEVADRHCTASSAASAASADCKSAAIEDGSRTAAPPVAEARRDVEASRRGAALGSSCCIRGHKLVEL